jgi:hypothetical protein
VAEGDQLRHSIRYERLHAMQFRPVSPAQVRSGSPSTTALGE